MHSKTLLSLALGLFIAEAAVASPCKPKTTTSVASTTLSESTTTIPSVPSTTETTLATIETSAASETSETETATTLLTSTTAASAVDTTTTDVGTTTADETTATTETGTKTEDTTTTEAQTTTTAEAETTTAEATTTTAGEPACAQTFVLANPTPIFDSSSTNDDSARSIIAPFPIGVFGASSDSVFVTTNGVISLDDYETSYVNNVLPDPNMPSISIMPYWDDLNIQEGICNTGIYYDVYETERGSTLTIEWQVGSIGRGSGEHFSASFYEDFPGVVRFEYYQTSRHGSTATVGLQNGQQYSQYSVNQDNSIPDQFYIIIDTSSGDAITLSGSL
ncbi:hypothetical protein F52700_12104 [Fusarium sp. NRRL 52700]|nr:hypothetical protein F52700_12104 [Fusarium sp. NRRL 52700]